tara:strand:- start:26 stop:907 length:882 start_codon:yes stop_codon:yes gene_type:complete
MKHFKYLIPAGLVSLLVAGCGSVELVNEISDMQTTRDEFKAALHKEYVALALKEQSINDEDDAVFFIKRAREVGLGLDLAPQPLSDRKGIPKYARKGLAAARASLVAKLWNGADELTPLASAKAQASFDCWLEEQEENSQPESIRACRQAFTAALFDMKVRAKPKAKAKVAKKKKVAVSRPPMPAPYVVYFGFDDAEVSDSEMTKIKQAFADYRLRKPSKILVAGHADSVGNKQYNLGLSRFRAASVVNELLQLGVPLKIIKKSRHGEVAPVIETGDNKSESKNRRVSITFIR